MADQLKLVKIYDGKGQEVLRSEKSDFSSVSFEKGYGKKMQAGVVLQGRAKGKVFIEMEIETYSTSAYTATTNEIESHVQTDVAKHLRESERSQNYKSWWFWLFSAADKDYEHYKDETEHTVSMSDTKITDSLTNNFTENKQKFRVTGEFEVESLRNIPTKVYLYIEMLNLTTKDGSTTSVVSVDTEPVAADENGNTKDIKSKGTLNVIPLS